MSRAILFRMCVLGSAVPSGTIAWLSASDVCVLLKTKKQSVLAGMAWESVLQVTN
jgi:hypothetical protein